MPHPKHPDVLTPEEAAALGIPRVTYVITTQRNHVLKGSPPSGTPTTTPSPSTGESASSEPNPEPPEAPAK